MSEQSDPEWWPLFAATAALGSQELIDRVVDLATAVCATRHPTEPGAQQHVDELVVGVRVLDYRYSTRGYGLMGQASTPRMEAPPPREHLADPHAVMVAARDRVCGDGAPGYVATTAGFVRDTFGAGPGLAGHRAAGTGPEHPDRPATQRPDRRADQRSAP